MFIVGFIWLAACFITLVFLASTWLSSLPLRKKLNYSAKAIAVPAVLFAAMMFISIFEDNQPFIEPTADNLSGEYVIRSGPLAGVGLLLYADGHYQIKNAPVEVCERIGPATGRWHTERQGMAVRLAFENDPGHLLHHQWAPYSIGVYLNDPDEGETTFEFNGKLPSTQSGF